MDNNLILLIIVIIIVILILWWFSSNTKSNSNSNNSNATLRVTLNGNNEVPPNNSAGTGSGRGTLSPDKKRFTFEVSVNNLTGPVMSAHFHRGGPGENGPIVKTLTFQQLPGMPSAWISRGVWRSDDPMEPLTDSLVQDLLHGRIYANYHTPQFPNGEVRGQWQVYLQ